MKDIKKIHNSKYAAVYLGDDSRNHCEWGRDRKGRKINKQCIDWPATSMVEWSTVPVYVRFGDSQDT